MFTWSLPASTNNILALLSDSTLKSALLEPSLTTTVPPVLALSANVVAAVKVTLPLPDIVNESIVKSDENDKLPEPSVCKSLLAAGAVCGNVSVYD